jgi:hypothetical protein
VQIVENLKFYNDLNVNMVLRIEFKNIYLFFKIYIILMKYF